MQYELKITFNSKEELLEYLKCKELTPVATVPSTKEHPPAQLDLVEVCPPAAPIGIRLRNFAGNTAVVLYTDSSSEELLRLLNRHEIGKRFSYENIDWKDWTYIYPNERCQDWKVF